MVTNQTVDKEAAEEMHSLFFEVLIAPEFTEEALEVLTSKKNRILLRQKIDLPGTKMMKTLLNGVIEQDKDLATETKADFKVVTQETPTEKEMDAMVFLNKMSFKKQTQIAEILDLRVSSFVNPDPDQIMVAMGNAAKDTSSSRKWGVPVQDKFIELAKTSNEDLALMVDIERALKSRVITNSRNEYKLNQDTLQGVADEIDLFRYFSKPENSEHYKDLLFLLKEKEKAVN